jgi:hypothetical protein
MMRTLFAKAKRQSALQAAWAAVALLILIGIAYPEPRPAFGMEQSNRVKAPAVGTPIAATTSAGTPDASQNEDDRPSTDPLDGDPLDGSPSNGRAEADLVRLDITRSGRPESAPKSVVAYDDDPDTVWEPDEESGEAWLWFDLGEDRELKQVRLLARGSGSIDIAISADRKDWETVEQVDAGRTWQETDLSEEARYVRLELTPNDDGVLPQIAEVEVYGEESREDASLEQKAKKKRKDKKDRKGKDNRKKSDKSDTNDARSNKDNDDEPASRDKGKSKGNKNKDRGDQAVETRDGISVQAGETDCRGDRARCRAQPGETDVEDECGDGGSCTIDIRADGGSATCDASAGDENEAGRGEGKRGGDGGRCEAVANGGAVAIGDINP